MILHADSTIERLASTTTVDEGFLIAHQAGRTCLIVAGHQAHWLEKALADGHEREKKHADCIELSE
jgi:hypothetical protein